MKKIFNKILIGIAICVFLTPVASFAFSQNYGNGNDDGIAVNNDPNYYLKNGFDQFSNIVPLKNDIISFYKPINASLEVKYSDIKDALNDFTQTISPVHVWHSIFKTHTFDKKVVNKKYLNSPADCENPAKYYYSCSCGAVGEETFDYGEPLYHLYTNYVSNNDATCTEDGTKTAHCERCGKESTIIDQNTKTGHSFSNEWSFDEGYHYHKAICGDTDEVIDKEKHIFSTRVITEATTENDGLLRETCTICGYYFDVIIPKVIIEHVFDQQVTDYKYLKEEATCLTPAIYYYSCECGEKGVETFEYGEPLGHSFSNDWTCDSENHWHSATCGHTQEVSDYAQHNFGDGEVTKIPTISEKGVYEFTCKICGYKKIIDIPQITDPTSLDYLNPVIINSVIIGRDDWLFYSGDNSIDYYRGTNIADDNYISSLKTALNNLNNSCKSRGAELRVLIGPNKEQIYPEYLPSYTTVNSYGNKRTDRIVDYFKATTDISYIYPLYDMFANKTNGDLYKKQDTHWNYRGAFIAYKQFMKSINREAAEVTYNEYTDSGGDLANMSGKKTSYTNWNCTYRPEVKYKYTNVLNDQYEYTNNNESAPGRLILFGDSFRNHFKFFAYRDFNETQVFSRDYRYQNNDAKNVVKTLHEGDVLLIIAVERFDYTIIYTASDLNTYLNS